MKLLPGHMRNPPRRKPVSPPGVEAQEIAKAAHETREGYRILGTIFFVSVPAIVFVIYSTEELENFGYGVFAGIPLAIGLACGIIYNWKQRWDWLASLAVTIATFLTVGLGLLALKIEGLICLVMAAALAWVIGLIGLLIAWAFRKLKARHRKAMLILCGFLPFLMAFEEAKELSPPLLEHTTRIEINAPPQVVWRYVPSFPKIENKTSWLLSLDLACPMESEMTGEGLGATRRCILSTGVMPEIITSWEPGKRLEFDVLETPPAMRESNPFGATETVHADHSFSVKRGRFVLTPLPGGKTLIEGTSWFQHDLWPQSYWAPMTKRVVREVHERVLEHIKQLSEQEAAFDSTSHPPHLR
jgi:hypothetical protein